MFGTARLKSSGVEQDTGRFQLFNIFNGVFISFLFFKYFVVTAIPLLPFPYRVSQSIPYSLTSCKNSVLGQYVHLGLLGRYRLQAIL